MPGINVLVIGSGAREHALVWKLLQSSRVGEVYVTPGNAGTGLIARNLNIPAEETPSLQNAAMNNNIGLTIVGPEVPLANGIVDEFQQRRLRIFGPTRAASRIEWSKAYAREFMQRYDIPHAKGAAFTDYQQAADYVYQLGAPLVVKADGLAQGKGVSVCASVEEALAALDDLMHKHTFGLAGNQVVIEEFLEGREVTVLAFTDGRTVVAMAPSTDYKRVFDGDQGPNTGGMGAYSPPPFFSEAQADYVRRAVLEAAVAGLQAEGTPYVGVLYAGLMVGPAGIKVLEFNSRFGDPEAQVVLPRLKTDIFSIMEACVDGRLDQITVEWSDEACVGVVMASEGYPERYESGFPITGLDEMDEGIRVFQAGTAARPMASNSGLRRLFATDLPQSSLDSLLSGDIQTAGGRVLTVVAQAPTVAAAREKVYRNIQHIHFQGAHYRTDVAQPISNEELRRLDTSIPALPAPGASPATGNTTS